MGIAVVFRPFSTASLCNSGSSNREYRTIGSGASFIYGFVMLTLIAISTANGDIEKAKSLAHGLYFESAAMILVLITLGKLLEALAKGKTTSAVKSLVDLSPKTARVIYATSAGFMFVMIYLKSRSLIVCILAHGIFNALSVFINETEITSTMSIITALAITLITGSYAVYLALALKKDSDSEGDAPGSSQNESDKG